MLSYNARQFTEKNNVELQQPKGVREPRTAGGLYWTGYWSKAYLVLDIKTFECGCKTAKHRKNCEGVSLDRITVQWATDANELRPCGEITSHMTWWDARRDAIIVERQAEAA